MNPKYPTQRLWLDCTDVFRYAAAGNQTVSGIQRVVLNLFAELSNIGTLAGALISSSSGLDFVVADKSTVSGLFVALQDGNSTVAEIREKCRNIEEMAVKWAANAGDTVLIAGAFWLHDPSLLVGLQQIAGLQIATFVHDVLIWRYPEYFLPADHAIWLASFAHILSISDLLITSSLYVECEIAACARALNIEFPEIRRVGMATSLPASALSPAIGAAGAVSELEKQRFVLCVGTVEARKNHALLLDVWGELHSELGCDAPILVFAGKAGWKVEALLERMQTLPWGPTHFLHLKAASDSELSWLYRNCLFTVYPSRAEGWGLPVSESLSYGVPCLAARAASLPEAGGDFAIYFRPDNTEEAVGQVYRLLDHNFRAQLRARISADFHPVDWLEFAHRVGNALITSRSVRQTPEIPMEKACSISGFGSANPARRATAMAALSAGWLGIEDGAAKGGVNTRLRLRTSVPEGTLVLLYCLLQVDERGQLSVMSAHEGSAQWIFGDPAARVQWTTVRVTHGAIDLFLQVINSAEGTKLYGLACSTSLQPSAALIAALEAGMPKRPPDPSELQHRLIGRTLPLIVRKLGGLVAKWRRASARRAARSGKWNEAIAFYDIYLRLSPQDGRIWKQLGHCYKEAGDPERAFDAYQLALAMDSDADSRHHVNTMREQLRHVQGKLGE